MKKLLFLISAILFISLSACGLQKTNPANIPTYSQTATSTIEITDTPVPTDTPNISISPSSTEPNYPTMAPTPTMNPMTINEIKLFVAALATGDENVISTMIQYPLNIYGKDYSSMNIYGPSDFKNNFDLLFDQDFLNWISSINISENIHFDYSTGEYEIFENDYSVHFTSSGKVFFIQNKNLITSTIHRDLLATTTPTLDPNDCWTTAMTQYDMNMCAGSYWKKANNTLQSLLLELKSHTTSDQYQTLLTVQKEWEQTVIDYCDWEGSFNGGGSMQGMVETNCGTFQYQQRINDLRMSLCKDNGKNGECAASLRYKQDHY